MSGQNEDAAWAEIVANYGDRPVLDESVTDDTTAGPDPEATSTRADPARDLRSRPRPEPDPHPELEDGGWLADRFVPPPPPPLPRVAKDRLAAWIGVLVSPLVLLVATVLQLRLPTMVAWLLIAGFLGGFGYLVAQMPRGPRDPFDDGARL